MRELIRVLYLDVSARNRPLVRQVLEHDEEQHFRVVEVRSPVEIAEKLKQDDFDIILTELDGFEPSPIEHIADGKGAGIPPVIVLAESTQEQSAIATMRHGAADYVVTTPSRIRRLPNSIRLAIEKKRLHDQNRKSQEELQKLTAELERRISERTAQLAAANDELEAFSYSVSHDLRAPLRAIEGFARILVEDYAAQLEPDARRCVDIILASTEQMNRLIQDLLAFSRLARAELDNQQIDMTELARSMAAELQAEQRNKSAIVTIPTLLPGTGDAAMIRQVFANFLGNALKFSRNNRTPRVDVGSYREGHEHVYFVKDNGVGFDMQYAPKLFNVFQRLHRADQFEGTGVGLAIVKRIVHRHRGRVWAEAEVDKGATFYFSLPMDERTPTK
jgi:signal transduction histidine kinase